MPQPRIKEKILELIAEEGLTFSAIREHFPDQSSECIRTHLSQLTRSEKILRIPPPKMETTWIAALPDDD